MDILQQIVAHTREIVAQRRTQLSLQELKARLASSPQPTNSLGKHLRDDQPNIIAEFKRRSPSRPNINQSADPVAMARAYELGGAAAMSVLTEPGFFAGNPSDLRAIRKQVALPLLRKDFMIDPYQFYEAREMGADLVLLIARILEPAQLADFTQLAHELGMEVLCEVHNSEELAKIGPAPVDFLGVNCRDLKQFTTNLDHLVAMTAHLPAEVPWVAESGMHSPDDVKRLFSAGYRLFLIGEYLMKSPDPSALLHQLRQR